MMLSRRCIVVLLAFVCSTLVQAQEFRCGLISELASRVRFAPAGDVVGDIAAGSLQGMPVYARCPSPGTVDHIGFQLFNREEREVFPASVCDFLERYFLDILSWKETSAAQKLRDDHVVISSGVLYDILRVRTATSFALDRSGDRSYTARWTWGNGDALVVDFPIDYELLTGMPQIEMERTLPVSLRKASSSFPLREAMGWESAGDGIYCSTPSDFVYLPEVNDRIYSEKSTSGGYQLLTGGRYPELVAANLFLGAFQKDASLHIRQRMYGFQAKDYSVKLSQWLSYCYENGLKTYFSIETEGESDLLALVIAENRDLGYLHLLSVAFQKDFMDQDAPDFKVKLDAFIPTHNVADLFQEAKEKPVSVWK